MPKRGSVNHRMERKTLPVFVTKVDGALGEVECIANVFGIVDMQRDIVHLGAFSKTIRESSPKIRVLDQHNTYSVMNVIGKILEIREVTRNELPLEITSKYPEATGGLYVRIQFLMNTPEGEGAFKRLEAGAIDEFSIAFESLDVDYSESEYEGKKVRVRNIRTVRLWEVSPVIWGANQATAVTGMKRVKEMTPDGPMTRLGDFLHAEGIRAVCGCLSQLYSSGYFTPEEWKSLDGIARRHLESMRVEFPEDLALRPLSYSSYYYLMRNRSEGAPHRVEEPEQRAEVPETPAEPESAPETPKALETSEAGSTGTSPDEKKNELRLRARQLALQIKASTIH